MISNKLNTFRLENSFFPYVHGNGSGQANPEGKKQIGERGWLPY